MNSYANKTRQDLISICKERKIKGYSTKNKNDIIQLLLPSTNTSVNTPTSPIASVNTIPKLKMIDLWLLNFLKMQI